MVGVRIGVTSRRRAATADANRQRQGRQIRRQLAREVGQRFDRSIAAIFETAREYAASCCSDVELTRCQQRMASSFLCPAAPSSLSAPLPTDLCVTIPTKQQQRSSSGDNSDTMNAIALPRIWTRRATQSSTAFGLGVTAWPVATACRNTSRLVSGSDRSPSQ